MEKCDDYYSTVGHKSHDPYFRVFLMEAGFMTFVAHCTFFSALSGKCRF